MSLWPLEGAEILCFMLVSVLTRGGVIVEQQQQGAAPRFSTIEKKYYIIMRNGIKTIINIYKMIIIIIIYIA